MAATAVTDLLKQARRRYVTLLAVAQSAHVASAALVGLVLLLLLGTQVLDWYWPLLLGLACAAALAYRFRRLPSLYRLAQVIDARLHLHDSLSTAYHFNTNASAFSEDVRRRQAEEADRLSRNVQLAQAFPFALPRTLYATGALGLLALAMLTVRYGQSQSLDLRSPLVSWDASLFSDDPADAARKQRTPARLPKELAQMGMSIDPSGSDVLPEAQEEDASSSPQGESLTPVDQPGSAREGSSGKPTPMSADGRSGEEQSGQGEQSTGDADSGQTGEQGDPQQEGTKSSQAQTPPQGAKQGNRSGEQNSLLDKMRDAMANLMNKMKLPQEGQQSQQASNGKPNQGQQQAQSGQGQKSKGQSQQGDPSNPQDQPGDQEAEGGEQAQSAKSQEGGKPGQDGQPKGGMGKQDGAKDIKEAEQLAAMGKISELLGKRSNTVSGEITVEVPSGSQKLVTAYSQRRALHADAGAESHRDEIPLAYQQYVQQYFEQVHKVPAKPKQN